MEEDAFYQRFLAHRAAKNTNAWMCHERPSPPGHISGEYLKMNDLGDREDAIKASLPLHVTND